MLYNKKKAARAANTREKAYFLDASTCLANAASAFLTEKCEVALSWLEAAEECKHGAASNFITYEKDGMEETDKIIDLLQEKIKFLELAIEASNSELADAWGAAAIQTGKAISALLCLRAVIVDREKNYIRR